MIRRMSRLTGRFPFIGLTTALALSVAGAAFAASDSSLALARSLADSEEHAQSALEYRRLAMDEAEPALRGAFFWMAGYEYVKADRFEQAGRMLDQAEDTAPGLEEQVYLLRGENSLRRGRPREAAFYLESLTASNRTESVRASASRKLAVVRLQARDYGGAHKALAIVPGSTEQERAAIEAYAKGRDKSPAVGGLLGLIPGMGYAYSGEYANAGRSLLMNALCIWGIVSFAEDEAWGGVAVVGFAEITFYTGSVYGGADAAIRHNRDRLEASTRVLEERAGFRPEAGMLPALSLRFAF
jgi:tetratricopeptide (TPR) repeat protein